MKTPKPEEKNPRILDLRAKRLETDTLKTAKISELALVRARLKSAPSYGNAEENRVRELLSQPLLPNVASDTVREESLLREIHDLNVKVAALDRAIRNETAVGSRLFLEDKAVKERISKSGNNVAKALLYLHSAVLEHDQTIDAVEDVGCDVGVYRVRLNGLSSPRDLSGGFWYAMRDLIDAGFMQKSELPKVYQ
jgi:hypothetical protein